MVIRKMTNKDRHSSDILKIERSQVEDIFSTFQKGNYKLLELQLFLLTCHPKISQ